MASICVSKSLRALCDDKSLALFNMIAFTWSQSTSEVMAKLGITRKQYYSRMSQLINAGLAMRKNGRYVLTSFGNVVYESHILIGQAVENYWQLKAIDNVEGFPENYLAEEERKNLIYTLIESDNIRNILLNHNLPSEVNNKITQPLKVST